MNRYVKKTLMIYITLALVLIGMASVSYAVTAADAYSYVTRSEYSTKMSELQQMLDEKESSLMGLINKYRTTDIKFVTFDSPDKYNTSNDYYGGEHTGGNFLPRTKFSSSTSGWGYAWGYYQGIADAQNGYAKSYTLHRLWNGDYYITNHMMWRGSLDASTSATYYVGGINCAVPVENLPGWYIVMYSWRQNYRYIEWNFSLVKLDPTVPYNMTDAEIQNKELIIRLKKDLWTYVAPGTTRLTNTKNTITKNLPMYVNTNYDTPLTHSHYSGNSTSTQNAVLCSGWLDPDTQDYMISYKNFPPTSPTNGTRTLIYSDGQDAMLTRFVPKDNVEYTMGPCAIHEYQAGIGASYPSFVPDSRNIGNGQGYDSYYEYEFVDCVNGIKYWHAYKKPGKELLGTANPVIFGFHYSLPIVY